MEKETNSKKYFRIGFYIGICLILSVAISLFLFRFYQIIPYLIIGPVLVFFVFVVNIFKEKGVKRKILWKSSEKILAIPSAIWISVFAFGLICHPASGWLNITMPSSVIRFPLSYLESIAIDESGNVYCLSGFYNRIQVFDNEGTFLKGWFVDLPGGGRRIRSEKDGEISLFSENNRTKMVYENNGLLLSKSKFESEEFKLLYPENSGPRKDALGNSHQIESPFFWIKVTRTSSEGNRDVVVKDPTGLWFVTIFFPFAWFALIKVVVFFSMRRLLKIAR